MKTRVGCLSAAGMMLVLAGDAFAESSKEPVITTLHDGNNAGPVRLGPDGNELGLDQAGPGSEQGTSIIQLDDGTLVMAVMANYADGKLGPEVTGEAGQKRGQCACVSGTIGADNKFKVRAFKYITDNNGNRARNCNHPFAIKTFGNRVLLGYNFALGPQAEQYALMTDGDCNNLTVPPAVTGPVGPGGIPLPPLPGQPPAVVSTTAQARIFGNAEAGTVADNFCATGRRADVVVSSTASRFVGLRCCGGNGNGLDDTWAFTYEATPDGNGKYNIKFLKALAINKAEERSRCNAWKADPASNNVQVVFTSGNTQPPNAGVHFMSLAVTEAGDISVVTKKEIEKLPAGDGVLATQIHASPLVGGNVLLAWQRTAGTRRRGKGTATGMMVVAHVNADGSLDFLTDPVPQGELYPRSEPTHLSMFPVGDGAVVLSTSVNGNPKSLSTAQGLQFIDGTLKSSNRINLGVSADNAWLSHIYGNNPNNQGRNYLDGDVVLNEANKKVLAMLLNTRRMDTSNGRPEQKLALEMVVIPQDAFGIPDSKPVPTDREGGGSSGCGCRAGDDGAAAGTLLLLAVALFGASLRRGRRNTR